MVFSAAIAASLLLTAGGAGAAATFTDPAGDPVGGAADITQLVVSNDAAGTVSFTLTTNRSVFSSDDFVAIVLDTDKNTGTGPSGVDYAIVVDAKGATLLRWNGATFDPTTAQTTLRASNNNMTVTINRSELGATKGFTFAAFSGLDSNNAADDSAPDSGGWVYDLALAPELDTLAARFSPAKPRAGHAFRVAGTVLRLDDGSAVKAESVTCRALLGGKRLAGRCSWRIPKNAAGKRLVVYLTVRCQGQTATFTPWRFVVGR
jgi:hypothetical protein